MQLYNLDIFTLGKNINWKFKLRRKFSDCFIVELIPIFAMKNPKAKIFWPRLFFLYIESAFSDSHAHMCHISIQYANQVFWHQWKYQKEWFFVSDSAGLQIELAMLCQSDTCENENKWLHCHTISRYIFKHDYGSPLGQVSKRNLFEPI